MRAANNRLYCTFVPVDRLRESIESLKGCAQGRIFILDIGKDSEVVVTYNAQVRIPEDFLKSTVLCHRHKLTRTLYTVNALNWIIRKENGGLEDRNFKIDWDRYQDRMLVVQDKNLIEFKTKILNII